MQVRTKLLEQEIQNVTKKISNLVQRVADSPAEFPAGPFCEQIKQLNQRLTEAKLAKEKLKTKEMDLNDQDIDQEGLKAGTDGNPSFERLVEK